MSRTRPRDESPVLVNRNYELERDYLNFHYNIEDMLFGNRLNRRFRSPTPNRTVSRRSSGNSDRMVDAASLDHERARYQSRYGSDPALNRVSDNDPLDRAIYDNEYYSLFAPGTVTRSPSPDNRFVINMLDLTPPRPLEAIPAPPSPPATSRFMPVLSETSNRGTTTSSQHPRSSGTPPPNRRMISTQRRPSLGAGFLRNCGTSSQGQNEPNSPRYVTVHAGHTPTRYDMSTLRPVSPIRSSTPRRPSRPPTPNRRPTLRPLSPTILSEYSPASPNTYDSPMSPDGPGTTSAINAASSSAPTNSEPIFDFFTGNNDSLSASRRYRTRPIPLRTSISASTIRNVPETRPEPPTHNSTQASSSSNSNTYDPSSPNLFMPRSPVFTMAPRYSPDMNHFVLNSMWDSSDEDTRDANNTRTDPRVSTTSASAPSSRRFSWLDSPDSPPTSSASASRPRRSSRFDIPPPPSAVSAETSAQDVRERTRSPLADRDVRMLEAELIDIANSFGIHMDRNESNSSLSNQRYSPTMPQYFPTNSSSTVTAAATEASTSASSSAFASRKRKLADKAKTMLEKAEASHEAEVAELKRKLLQSDEQNSQLRKENEDLKKEITCIICLVDKRDTIFFPCTHMHSCNACAERQTECAICRQNIGGKFRIFS